MILKKSIVAITMILGAVSFVQAAGSSTVPQGHGKITFTGSIVDAPCSVSPESTDQTISLGEVSNVALANGGTSTPKPFEIHLIDCSLSTAKTVTTTFTGATDPDSVNKAALGITGTAKGAGIVLTDGAGGQIALGKALAAQTLQNGSNTLSYSAYLQGDSGKTIVPGDFQGVTDFTLAYQ